METRICQTCQKEKRIKQFSLLKSGERSENCRICNYDGTPLENKHIILREAYRHYLTFKQLVSDANLDVIEYSIPAVEQPEDGTDAWQKVSISFSDLERALKTYQDGTKADGTVLAKRKEQAFYLNVIRDMRQKDVAELMGITTVSVGQYVEQSVLQLAAYYFGEMDDERTLHSDTEQGVN